MSLFFVACFEDDNKYDYAELNSVTIEGIEEKYSKISHQDILSISPTVTTESEVEYVWELWTSVRKDGIIYTPDTIGRAKDLNYEVNENPGTYYLVFNVTDKATKVTTTYRSTLEVSTINSKGWYLLKDEGTSEKYTDYDFIYDGGRIDNWIAFYNDGKKLKGEAVKSIFSAKYSDATTGGGYSNIDVLIPVAKEELAVMNLNSGKIQLPIESLFFESLEVKNFQDIYIANDEVTVDMVNDYTAYRFITTNATSFYPLYGNYRLSKAFRALPGTTYFDDLSKSFVYINYGNFARFVESSNAPISCNNMDADLIWSSSVNHKIQNLSWPSYALMKKNSEPDSYMVVKLNLNGFGNDNRIRNVNILPATSGLPTAEARAVNANFGVIYFVKDQKLYKYVIDNQHEEAILDLPAGEKVTCMQHIMYPNPMSETYGSEIDCFAIATYANGKYKVWLHEFDADNLKPLSEPTFEGNGRVACINYVESSSSNFLF